MKLFEIVIIFIFFTTQSLAADLKSLKYFKKSIIEIQARFSYEETITKKTGAQVVTHDQINKILSYTKNSLFYSNKVLDKDLDQLDPAIFYKNLADKYENLFRNGLRLSIASMENNDIKKGLKSQKLLNEWGEYYRKTRVKIFKK
mgnify:CR=1 FL=1|jgi:hypothetical protein